MAVAPWRKAALARMPTDRLGRFLAKARRDHGESLQDVAARLDNVFTPTVLAMVERGAYRVPGDDVVRIVEAYRVDVEAVLPPRPPMEIDLARGRLRVDGEVYAMDERPSTDDVLEHYLRFVRRLRGLAVDARLAPSSIRHEDVVALADALGLTPADVDGRLVGLLDPASREAREAIGRASRERSAFGARLAEAARRREVDAEAGL